MFYLVNFIFAVLLVALLNLLYHNIKNRYMFKKHGTDRFHSTGRIVDFKTGKSKTQYGPYKSY